MKTISILLLSFVFSAIACSNRTKETEPKQIIEIINPEDTLTRVSFKVDNVTLPDSLLEAFKLYDIIENRVGKKLSYLPDNNIKINSLACYNNGLIQTIHSCYDQHRPLILTPDAIWLTISQGISIHINQNYDSLSSTLFKTDKQVELYVQNDSLELGGNHWATLIDSLALKTKYYAKNDFYNLAIGDFSTTSKINTTVYQISLLETYKQKFNYTGGTGCGIPNITLKGTLNDWRNIYDKLNKLNDLGLEDWSNSLKPIIKEFINCYQGDINTLFWKDIYKNASVYGGRFVSGWIVNLFPYTKSIKYTDDVNEYGQQVSYEIYKPNKYLGNYNYLRSDLTTKSFPDGVSVIDLKWINYLRQDTTEMEVYGGFFGIKQYSDMSLEPIITWTICKKNITPIEQQYFRSHDNSMLNRAKYYWSPAIIKTPTKPAIYNPKYNKTYEKSHNNFKTKLVNNVTKYNKKTNTKLDGIVVKLVILSNGTVNSVTVKNCSDKALESFIIKSITKDKTPWQSALMEPKKMHPSKSPLNYRGNELVKVNSYYTINF